MKRLLIAASLAACAIPFAGAPASMGFPALEQAAEARGTYCRRHPTACRERRERAAERARLAREERERFESELRARLTAEQYERITQERESLYASNNKLWSDNREMARQNRELLTRPTWTWLWIWGFFAFWLGGTAVAMFTMQDDRRGERRR